MSVVIRLCASIDSRVFIDSRVRLYGVRLISIGSRFRKQGCIHHNCHDGDFRGSVVLLVSCTVLVGGE